VFKTLSPNNDEDRGGSAEPMPDIIFMCISKNELLELCDLFPQTAENIKRRSLERRQRFMLQKNTNSKRYKDKLEQKKQNQSSTSIDNKNDGAEEMPLDEFYSDEEPENFESQKEDMKMYLNKLNKRIDTLVDALKEADTKMASMKD
jgi:hypothetical protein